MAFLVLVFSVLSVVLVFLVFLVFFGLRAAVREEPDVAASGAVCGVGGKLRAGAGGIQGKTRTALRRVNLGLLNACVPEKPVGLFPAGIVERLGILAALRQSKAGGPGAVGVPVVVHHHAAGIDPEMAGPDAVFKIVVEHIFLVSIGVEHPLAPLFPVDDVEAGILNIFQVVRLHPDRAGILNLQRIRHGSQSVLGIVIGKRIQLGQSAFLKGTALDGERNFTGESEFHFGFFLREIQSESGIYGVQILLGQFVPDLGVHPDLEKIMLQKAAVGIQQQMVVLLPVGHGPLIGTNPVIVQLGGIQNLAGVHIQKHVQVDVIFILQKEISLQPEQQAVEGAPFAVPVA